MRRPPPPSKKSVLTNQKKVDTSPPVAVHSAPDTSIWLSRRDATVFVGCSASTLLNCERRGELHPQFAYREDPDGIRRKSIVYHPDELTKIKKRVKRAVREPSEYSARAFDLFRAGTKLEAVVSELRTTPEEVERLYEKWLDLGGARLVIAGAAKEDLEKIIGPFDSVTEMVAKVTTRLKPPEDPVEQSKLVEMIEHTTVSK